ncbi:NAD(P)/FAD-dependent oxidoreductase [Chloroflexota bacterium]
MEHGKLYDAVIIGGGPVGSHVACQLAGKGHKVAVLERKRGEGKPVCCTGLVGQECVRAFAIEGDVILRTVNSARLFSPSGNQIRLFREETQACILDRTAFDAAMTGRARDKGAEYISETLVRDMAVDEEKVTIATSRNGESSEFETRAAVITTGFGSRLAERMGLGNFGDFVIGAQAEVKTAGIDEVEAYFGGEIVPGFFGWLVPTSSQTARVGLLSRRKPRFYLRKLISSLQAQGKIVSAETEPSCGGIPLETLDKTYSRRLLVVGDAAGQVKPTTGGGIYYGLLCAEIAANTLHQALQSDDLSARGLEGYERGWKRIIGQELKMGCWARKLFERLGDRRIEQIFDIVKSHKIDEELLQTRNLSFDWHSKTIMMLLGRAVVARVLGMTKAPAGVIED